MYWKLFRQKVEDTVAGRRARMGFISMTGLLIVLLLLASLFAFHENGKGNLTRLKKHLATTPNPDATPRPGGQDAVVLSRSPLPGAITPEFLSATLLPGRGLDVLRITAYLPEKGEVDLLAGATVAEAAAAMSGITEDAAGQASLTRGAPFLVPWAGRLGGILSPDGQSVGAGWHGRSIDVPANLAESVVPTAYGGLLLKAPSGSIDTNAMPDGGSVTATFPPASLAGAWPSSIETRISVLLSGRVLELAVDAKNTGEEASPIGIGWAPRFLIPSGDRRSAALHLPADMRSETDRRTALPTGRLDPVAGTPYDFSPRNGVPLGTLSLDDTFLHLRAPLDEHPTVELRDPAARFGIRMTLLSDTIKSVHVYAPANANFVAISPRTNLDDPFGRQWPANEDTGMQILQPGQTAHWKIRLELFPLMNHPAPPL